MPSCLLVAGLDARSLALEAPLLRRERHVIEERATARELLQDIAPGGARLVLLGPRLPYLSLTETIRRIRASPAIRQVSVLALLTAEEPPDLESQALHAGANAVMRRPLQREQLEHWLAKLLLVARRVQMRIPVQGQVVGTRRGAEDVIVGRLIPAGTGLAHHRERRRKRKEAAPAGRGGMELDAQDVEEALKQALNTSDS